MTVVNPRSLIDGNFIVGNLDPNQIQQVGIDLTIDKLHEFAPDSESAIGKNDRQLADYRLMTPLKKVQATKRGKTHSDTSVITMEEGWMLKPGYYLWDAKETITVPQDAMAIIIQRSTFVRAGVQILTGVWDPGFQGVLGGNLIVHNPIRLERGARVAQIIFWKAEPASQYSGAYMNTSHGSSSGMSI